MKARGLLHTKPTMFWVLILCCAAVWATELCDTDMQCRGDLTCVDGKCQELYTSGDVAGLAFGAGTIACVVFGIIGCGAYLWADSRPHSFGSVAVLFVAMVATVVACIVVTIVTGLVLGLSSSCCRQT